MSESNFSLPAHERKIAPVAQTRQVVRPDGTPDENDRLEIGPTPLAFKEWSEKGISAPVLDDLREYRLARLQSEMVKEGHSALLLFDPLNIRYATDAANMQVWVAHNLSRACLISVDGPVKLWEFVGCEHMAEHLPLVSELGGPNAGFTYFLAGDEVEATADEFAVEVLTFLDSHCGGDRRLIVDKIEIAGLRSLEKIGLEVVGGQTLVERARLIKSENEVNAMRCSISACEASIAAMQEKLRPGITENELWATLHYENIRRGGEWIETRLLASGPRTNPWFQECGPRIIQEGDLVAFDTDMIGVYGYCSDISRTWLCGEGMPSRIQKELYKFAHEELRYNIDLIRPGLAFREWAESAFQLPEKYRQLRYGVMAHGVGLCDEYPAIRPLENHAGSGEAPEVLEPGMTICVESYIGEVGGHEGVKLEDQVLVTETGCENLTKYPFEDKFF